MRIVPALIILLFAMAGPALAERVTLSGEVTYRERIALPPDTTLSIALIDLATPDRPRLAAAAPIASPGQVPLTFNLGFEDSIILPGNSYALLAEIVDAAGTVVFSNAEPYRVAPLAPEAPILIVLSPVAAPAPEPELVEPEAEAAPLPPILDVTWRADEIMGEPVAGRSMVSLSIGQDMRAGGRGGCNSWFSQVRIEDNGLAFSAVAATRMACTNEAVAAQEQQFFAALAATRMYRLEGETLLLLDAAGTELVRMSRSRF